MAAREYEFHLRFAHSWEMLSAQEDKIRIPKPPWNVCLFYRYWWNLHINHKIFYSAKSKNSQKVQLKLLNIAKYLLFLCYETRI